MKEYSNRKYIYSANHANELMEEGYRCLGTGYNSNSGKFFWVFDYLEIQPYYQQQKNLK